MTRATGRDEHDAERERSKPVEPPGVLPGTPAGEPSRGPGILPGTPEEAHEPPAPPGKPGTKT